MPANAKSIQINAAGFSCVGKDLVSGVCLSKSRKKYSKTIENNFLLSCVASAVDSWASDIKIARSYCGCTLENVEKVYNQSAYLKAEQVYLATGQYPQKIINAVANCQQYIQ